jgi:hypothetical protein
MSFVNDGPKHLIVLDAISRGMKSVSKANQGHEAGQGALVEMVVNDLVSRRLVVIAEKKGFFGGKKERNND